MHNEYGLDDIASDTGQRVVGLKSKFPARVRVVGLGHNATIRGQVPDFNLEIAMKDIQPEDVLLLAGELNLKETTPTVLQALLADFGRNGWFQSFRNMVIGATATIVNQKGKDQVVPAHNSTEYWCDKNGVNRLACNGLHAKLSRLFHRPYIQAKPAADGIDEVIKALEAGQHVILSFGKFESDLDYLLVSNILTRKIRDRWEQRTNDFRTGSGAEPRQLVITVEEAHKLLSGEMSRQTTFGTIARELRKYFVTLLVVDQRPSQICDEVMSQLGTRISGWLGDDDDVRAVLAGLAGRDALSRMLARLQPKEEVVLLGWGVPMPLPIRSRRYDDRFWRELFGKNGQVKEKAFNPDDTLKELGF
jgi:hypothetical protein